MEPKGEKEVISGKIPELFSPLWSNEYLIPFYIERGSLPILLDSTDVQEKLFFPTTIHNIRMRIQNIFPALFRSDFIIFFLVLSSSFTSRSMFVVIAEITNGHIYVYQGKRVISYWISWPIPMIVFLRSFER